MATRKAAGGVRLVKTSLAEQAYDELRRQILDRRLEPGERLNIDALSRECGISSSPLREALVRLGAEGLVAFAANTGFSVAPLPDARQMDELMAFRRLIEAHCARVGAAGADDETLAALGRAVDAMAAMREKGVGYRQLRAFSDLDEGFHRTLVDSAGNRAISAAWRDLHLILSVARLSVVPDSNVVGSDDALQEHRRIVAAFEARDPDAAEAAVRAHLDAAMERLRVRRGAAAEAATADAKSSAAS